MVAPFRLESGDSAPRQQLPTTCGAASLTVARMLADPWFARWIQHGPSRKDVDAARAPFDEGGRGAASAVARFAAYERRVTARTNSLFNGSRPQVPWPRALGTPPWGARRELQRAISPPGSRYSVGPLRHGSRTALDTAFSDLCVRVGPGRPALLYVGSRSLPRHVVLVLPATGHHDLDVYEPSSGRVLGLGREGFVARRLALAGWDVPWAAIWADRARAASLTDDAGS